MSSARIPGAGIARVLAALALLAVVGVRAEVPVPPLKARVTDLTGTLSAEQQAALEKTLREFEVRKGTQIAVLLVPTTQPETIEQYSIRVVEQWKLGRKKVDDGVLVLLAVNDRKLRIEVGYGLEAVLPDATAKRIIDEQITPRLRQRDFAGGIRAGVEQMMRLIGGEPVAPPAAAPTASLPAPVGAPARSATDDSPGLGAILLAIALSIIVLGIVIRAFMRAKAIDYAVCGLGGAVAGLMVGWAMKTVLWALVVGLVIGIVFLCFQTWPPARRRSSWRTGDAWSSGGGSSGGGSSGSGWSLGDIFSGGGGSFGGGGASGDWGD